MATSKRSRKPAAPTILDGIGLALETLETALGWKGARRSGDPLPERMERAACAAGAQRGAERWPSFAPQAQRRDIAQALETLQLATRSALDIEASAPLPKGATESEALAALRARDTLRVLFLLAHGWTPERASTGWEGYSAPWDTAAGSGRPGFVQTLPQALDSQAWSESTGAKRYPTCAELDAWKGARVTSRRAALSRPGGRIAPLSSGEEA